MKRNPPHCNGFHCRLTCNLSIPARCDCSCASCDPVAPVVVTSVEHSESVTQVVLPDGSKVTRVVSAYSSYTMREGG